MQRRTFLKSSGVALATLAIPDLLLADPYAPIPGVRRASKPVRIRGRVHSASRGIGGVAVTDGVTVTLTEPDGTYTLIADGNQPFVSVSVPAGHRIPVSPTGTASFYRAVDPARDEMTADFPLDRLPDGDERHGFLVLADPQTQNTFEMQRFHAETVPDVQETVRGLGDLPLFGVGDGDIMYDDLALYPEYERAVREVGVPFFQVIGNHDLVQVAATDEGAAATFQQHFGPTYYSFDRGSVHYVVLDDVFWYGAGYIGYCGQQQLTWLTADLARVESGRTVVVFLHIPVLSTRTLRNGEQSPGTGESMTNREALYRLLEPYDGYVLSGHTHEHDQHHDGGVRHHVHGTVCGAWWSGDICWDGTPNGYGVYEVDGEEVRWRYKSTGQPPEHQMRVYSRGSDPRAPDEIVANIWDADDTWTVTWFEDGERRGQMSRRPGYDPRAVVEQTGDDRPPRREWVEPTTTNHLYYAPVSATTREVRVEAVDTWGHTYIGVNRRRR